jgi:uncharacterized protein (DUF58 family)
MMLERDVAGRNTNLLNPLEQIAKLVRKRGLIVLISDLLAPLDQLQTHLGYLRSRGHEVMVLRVLDPAETQLPLEQAARFRDLESEREMFIDPQAARPVYQRRFEEHRHELRKICTRLGVDLVQMLTDERLDSALYELLAIQIRGGPPSKRRTYGRTTQRGGIR